MKINFVCICFFILLTIINTINVQAEECPACLNRTLAPTPHNTSSAPGYCTSHGGSHAYEYIQDVSYTQNPSGTLTITVDIYIVNPTGCTYGNPCPEYDSSPEYINAWIDWDGDKVFEPEERVMDEALTGYININYHGTMTASTIVTIPGNAVPQTWMRVNLGWGHDPNDPCEYSWTWGDVVDKEVQIGKPDLSVKSTDISISPKSWWKQPSDISVTVHNDGTVKAENVKVKIIKKQGNTELKSEIKTIDEIPPGSSFTVSVNWNLDPFKQDIEVIVDPDDEIDELKEDNNEAKTHKITGRVTNSDGQPLKNLKIEYLEQNSGKWQTKVTTFTNSDGKYALFVNMKEITDGKQGKIRASLEYSPNRDGKIKFRFYNDTQWDAGRIETAHKDTTSWVMDKTKDYSRDISFTWQEGGRVYYTSVSYTHLTLPTTERV